MLDKTIRIFVRFVYEKVTILLDIRVPANNINTNEPNTTLKFKKLMDQITPFVKK